MTSVALRDYARLMRPHQWVKNAFVAAPLFFTPSLVGAASVGRVALGFACFCALASAVYILNDWRDAEADRAHPIKRDRPLASGAVQSQAALTLMAGLIVASLALAALLLPGAFVVICLIYLVNNIAYSFGLKNRSILDIMSIAFGFVLRIFGGAALIPVSPSAWIVICTGLLALFLAVAKRRDDLVQELGHEHRQALSGYSLELLDAMMTMVLGALIVSYAIYTTDRAVMNRLDSELLYFTVPFVLLGVFRYLQIALVEKRSGSPTKIVLSDPFMIATILGWIAAFAILIY